MPIVTEDEITSRTWHRSQVPVFHVTPCAKLFFGKSASWLRGLMQPDKDHPNTWFTHPDGSRMEFRRAEGGADGPRLFMLSDIEPMAESRGRLGRIDAGRLELIRAVVRATAALYGLGERSR